MIDMDNTILQVTNSLPTVDELKESSLDSGTTLTPLSITDTGYIVRVPEYTGEPTADAESLYYAELKLLTTYCRNCLDNKMKDKIIMFLLKKTLYDNAITLQLEDDAKQYFDEMMNLLDLKTCNCTINDCNNCKDGYCRLCK